MRYKGGWAGRCRPGSVSSPKLHPGPPAGPRTMPWMTYSALEISKKEMSRKRTFLELSAKTKYLSTLKPKMAPRAFLGAPARKKILFSYSHLARVVGLLRVNSLSNIFSRPALIYPFWKEHRSKTESAWSAVCCSGGQRIINHIGQRIITGALIGINRIKMCITVQASCIW